MSSMGSGAASSLHTDDTTVSSLGTAGMHVRRSQGSPVGDSFTRLIIMLLMDADARASAAQNAIADLDAWTTLEVMMQTTLEGLNVAD